MLLRGGSSVNDNVDQDEDDSDSDEDVEAYKKDEPAAARSARLGSVFASSPHRWRVERKINGVRHAIGIFDSKREATRALDAWNDAHDHSPRATARAQPVPPHRTSMRLGVAGNHLGAQTQYRLA